MLSRVALTATAAASLHRVVLRVLELPVAECRVFTYPKAETAFRFHDSTFKKSPPLNSGGYS